MKVVTRDVQDLYERKVVEEFRWALRKGLSIDNSYVEAIVMARGISYGGSCLGFEYDFDKCIKSLDIVYNSHKWEVNR